ncbi:hypothetical protein SB394_10365 [Burkholderia sp. BCCIQ04A]|uniref:Lipoprotein n=1 Tax=Burkholderia anthinoferrum TaxID=3090833 RepID=A0ABU5WTJ0_9BURK|nr:MULTISPECIES: hypothetical protein [Burkholderia]MEB2505315.1 hypothetical protein [Burkholderia anthinoferrum]MEB2529986.1 hypothetical protein [Burkholderia anthinoferrum]MEB2563580.1 hypothetical protein [Burkholderia anthinoferrum]MEB2582224.1 hypothetical protein [Burkholderia anthinoferrum]KVH12685.1 hypothetical protein WS85_10590 [Burkholderia anthina]
MKNSSKATLVGCGLLVTLLSACTTVPNTDMTPEARQKLHSIAMLDVIEPKRVAVVNFGGAAAGFGLIGALAQGAVNASHTSTYTDHVAAGKILFAPDIADGVAGRLTGNGYQVVKLDGQKVKLADDGKSDDYSAIQTDADAIMNVWFTSFGYISPPQQLDYIPWVVIRARILDAKTKQDLYYKTFACGYDVKANSVHIDSDFAYTYGSFSDLEKNFDKSVEGIKSCEKSVADMIGQDLARTPASAPANATASTTMTRPAATATATVSKKL